MMDLSPLLTSAPLVGYIEHIISGGKKSASKKRPRHWDGGSNQNDDGGAGSSHHIHKGFIFIPEERRPDDQASTSSSSSKCSAFPLVIPLSCLRSACYAAATGKPVRMRQYSLIHYRGGFGELVFSSRNNEQSNMALGGVQRGNDDTASADHSVAIEVHHDGLCFASSDTDVQGEQNAISSMDLETLAQKEAQKQQTRDTKSKKKKSAAFGKDPMNVAGVVDAISPILVNDSQEEPFAIMELYQLSNEGETDDAKSVVAVIRGEKALCMHPSIQPGQSVTLMGVVSRRWKVPAEFEKHHGSSGGPGGDDLYERINHRVPDRVILVTEASAIRWSNEYGTARSLSPSLPSTVDSLTSLRGVVKSVHYHFGKSREGRKTSPIVHFVTLSLLTPTEAVTNRAPFNSGERANEQHLAYLYLPKYAVPPNLALGMQPGAILRAVNVHAINLEQENPHSVAFVACLRSALAIERCAGESYHNTHPPHNWFVAQENPFQLVPDHRITDICSNPSNTKPPAQHLAEEKLRNGLTSKLSACSPSQADSTEHQIFNEDRHGELKSPSDERKCNPHTLAPKLDALFAHHQRIATGNDQRKGCSSVKRKSKRVSSGKNGRLSMRDPYAEFFDHAHSSSFSDAIECGSSCNVFSSFSHHQRFAPTNLPLVIELGDLRSACAHNFMSRVAICMRSKLQTPPLQGYARECLAVTSGWTASFFYHGLKLRQALNDFARSQGSSRSTAWHGESADFVYSWGNVGINVDTGASIRGSSCAIPVCEFQNRSMGNQGLQDLQLESNGLPAWVQIDSVIVSCLCLGSSQEELQQTCTNSNQTESEDSYGPDSSLQVVPHTFLPSTVVASKEMPTDGHGFIFVVDKLVFVASVHIASKSIAPMEQSRSLNGNSSQQGPAEGSEKEMNAPDTSKAKHDSMLSVQGCLEQTPSQGHNGDQLPIIGRLVRQRFNFRKLKPMQRGGGQQTMHPQKCYEGWTIILSHSDPSASDVLSSASVLQTIEVKVSIPFGKSAASNSGAFNLALLRLFHSETEDTPEIGVRHESGKFITPDQLTLGLAWWTASGDSRTWPLLSGGWDERKDEVFVEKTLDPSIHVHIPLTSRTFSKLGYQRFRCNLNEIKSAFVIEHRGPLSKDATPSQSYSRYESDCRGSSKFLPGMLNRRLHRVPPLVFNVHERDVKKEPMYLCRNQHSNLTCLPRHGGVPSATLAELHWDICAALKGGNNAHIKPSLLRRVYNPKILGISFCRVHVECTQCFQALKRGQTSINSKHASTGHRYPPTSNNTSSGKIQEKSSLACPSGCSRSHAAVKWECSAVIDDGTGQSKVYAERECALLLLGGSLDVAAIESGAWGSDGGIFFQPALPASTRLMGCIQDATTQARKCASENKLNRKEKRHRGDLPSVLSLLPADAKAEYLLYQHCRQWYQRHHQRNMDLFVRCKPLSEEATSVNHAEIQVAKAWIAKVGLDYGTTSTATLPPLKLSLEDACIASEDDFDDNASGWNLLKQFN